MSTAAFATLDDLAAALAGPPPAAAGRDAWLKQVYILCHPDRYPPGHPDAGRAAGLLARALALVEDSKAKPVTLRSPKKRTYTLNRLLAAGDVADVHLASSEGHSYILKASRVPEGLPALEAEARVVRELLEQAGTTTYARYLPTLCESFPVRAGGRKKLVNVFRHEPGYVTLEAVHARHPTLDGRHVAWAFRRLLTVLGFAHRAGFVHWAVVPAHVLVHPETHGLMLVGWGQAVRAGEVIRRGSAQYLGWYPEEVRRKRPASSATDIGMAAFVAAWLAGGGPEAKLFLPYDFPEPFRRFLHACTIGGPAMRPSDAWGLEAEFGDLLERVYGPPKFVELSMS